jgi:hypothetical protein
MALPLLPLYYGLLIIASILFINYYDQEKFIEGSTKIAKNISSQGEVVKEHFVELKDTVLPYIEEYTDILIGQFNKVPFKTSIVEEKKSIQSIHNTKLFQKIDHIYQSLDQYIIHFLNDHPEIIETLIKIWKNVDKYATIIYDNIYEKVEFIANQKPVKIYLNEYVKFHDKYITPYVELSSDIISQTFSKIYTYINENINIESAGENENNEVRYMILIVIIGVFVLRYTLMSILRYFAKDAFQMHKSVSDMYKQHQLEELHNPAHNDVYMEIKETSLTNFQLTIDELEEEEEREEIENQDQEADTGSNRTSGSNRTKEKDQQQQQQQQQQKQKKEQKEKMKRRNSSSSTISSLNPPATTSLFTTTTATTNITVTVPAQITTDKESVRSLLM